MPAQADSNLYKAQQEETEAAVRNLLASESDPSSRGLFEPDFEFYRTQEQYTTATDTVTNPNTVNLSDTENSQEGEDRDSDSNSSSSSSSSSDNSSSSSSSSSSDTSGLASTHDISTASSPHWDPRTGSTYPCTSTPIHPRADKPGMNAKVRARATSKERKLEKAKAEADKAIKTKTGTHDNTVVSMDSDEDTDNMPPPPKKLSLRERITKVYDQRVADTKAKRPPGAPQTTSSEIKVVPYTEHVEGPLDPLEQPVTLDNAPTVTLRELLADEDKTVDANLDEEIKSSRLEFILVERPDAQAASVAGPSTATDPQPEWEIPSADTFEEVIGQAIAAFTDINFDYLNLVEYSTLGWNSGVGMFAVRSDRPQLLAQFRYIIRQMSHNGKQFETYARKMILNKYALTCYFNRSFRFYKPEKLCYWLLRFNPTLEGNLDIVEVRRYASDHSDPKRRDAQIIAFEGDSKFLASLQRHHKDFAFSIKIGGNLYIRGGDRVDSGDPSGVPPKVTRQAVKRILKGAGTDILNQGQSNEDSAAKNAQNLQQKKT